MHLNVTNGRTKQMRVSGVHQGVSVQASEMPLWYRVHGGGGVEILLDAKVITLSLRIKSKEASAER